MQRCRRIRRVHSFHGHPGGTARPLSRHLDAESLARLETVRRIEIPGFEIALSSGVTGLSQRAQPSAGHLAHEVSRRDDLYKNFIVASSRTVASAEKIMEATLSAYFSPNKTMRELHDLMKSGAGTPNFQALPAYW